MIAHEAIPYISKGIIALWELSLTTLRERVVKEYPTMSIGDWDVSYAPSNWIEDCDGNKLAWVARQASRQISCSTFAGLISAIKADYAIQQADEQRMLNEENI